MTIPPQFSGSLQVYVGADSDIQIHVPFARLLRLFLTDSINPFDDVPSRSRVEMCDDIRTNKFLS